MRTPGSSCPKCQNAVAAIRDGVQCPVCRWSSTVPVPAGVATVANRKQFGLGDEGVSRALPAAPRGYEMVAQIGCGGMGDVFLVRESGPPGRDVALKYLRFPSDRTQLLRFQSEIELLAKLNHRNIVRVYAADLKAADPYFTMEYAEGGSVARRVSRDRPLPAAEAVRIVREIAAAVAVAHDAGVIHRDIKPSNILLATERAGRDPAAQPLDRLVPKLSDFGLAKLLRGGRDLTDYSGGVGTPGYMPPEQGSAEFGNLGRAADVYALGATLFHLVVGRPPFEGKHSPAEIARRDPPHPAGVGRGLAAVIRKCLEPRPEARYATADELVEDLDRVAAGQPPRAARYGRVRNAARWAGRNWTGFAGVAAAVGLVFAGTLLVDRPRTDAATERPAWTADDVRRQIAAGRTVLVGPTGAPRYYRAHLEPVTLGESIQADGTCAFQSFNRALVELCPAPGVSSYEVTMELKHLRPAPGATSKGSLGMYFGYAGGRKPDGTLVSSAYAATFQDGLAAVGPAGLSEVVFERRGLAQGADIGPRDFLGGRERALKFTPTSLLPGEWRVLRLDVTPSGFRVEWHKAADEWETITVRSAESAAAESARFNSLVGAPSEPGVPAWHPDMPFGVVSSQAAVAVRNVVITPRP